ncbi:ATP-binding protein [Spirosoma spitsbergense]|uniref:ATP-binding protein n=1 Tax=Spirosoma spitsbergense TaxID=431554 RepID=UPI00037FB35E
MTQPDGNIRFEPASCNNSTLNLLLSQTIAPTGGTVFVQKQLQRFDNFIQDSTLYKGIPFGIGQIQPLLYTNQLIDVEQMEQVLVNVVKNALEACGPGQCVDVISRTNYLLIRNNGQPIPAEIAANLFNPFYSTRSEGQGIGLTLSREILLNHQFSFSLRTNDDGWTAFRIEFG